MNLGLRTRLLGTLIGAILIFVIIVTVAVNTTLRRDLNALETSRVSSGADALLSNLRNRSEQTTFILQQAAGQRALPTALASHNSLALKEIAQSIAQPNALSFVTIVDATGTVVARATGPAGGRASGTLVRDALAGQPTNGYVLLNNAQMKAEHAGDGSTSTGIALESVAPIMGGPKVVGAIEAGTLFSGASILLPDVARFTGGEVSIVAGQSVISSSLRNPDGSAFENVPMQNASEKLNGPRYIGEDTVGDTRYFVQIDSLVGADHRVIGATWFGIPSAQITAIEHNATNSVLWWAAFALLIAVGIGIYVVNKIVRAIALSSEQVGESARALDVLVVGTEVSNDHVMQTREKLETVERLLERVIPVSANGEGTRLRTLAKEATGDIIVIDTLATELNDRMRGAVDRVAELNSVVERLQKLVNGSRN